MNRSEIEEIVGLDEYAALVRQVCTDAVKTPQTTYLFMERYADINGFAGSGVALLAGNIGYSRKLFADPRPSVAESAADRGMLVAREVFAATVDEHADAHAGGAPHNLMAQCCVIAVALYAHLTSAQRKALDQKPQEFLDIVERFKKGYTGTAGDFRALVKAIGYHIASELTADSEYQIVDEILWHKNPDQNFRKQVNGTAWLWVSTHGHFNAAAEGQGHGVEDEHFEHALKAFDYAVRFRPANISETEMNELVSKGMREFRDVFTAFYLNVQTEIALRQKAQPTLESPYASP